MLRVLVHQEEGPLEDGTTGLRWTASLVDFAVSHATYGGMEDALRGLLEWVEAGKARKYKTRITVDPKTLGPEDAEAVSPAEKALEAKVHADNEAAFWRQLPKDVPEVITRRFESGKPLSHLSTPDVDVRLSLEEPDGGG